MDVEIGGTLSGKDKPAQNLSLPALLLTSFVL